MSQGSRKIDSLSYWASLRLQSDDGLLGLGNSDWQPSIQMIERLSSCTSGLTRVDPEQHLKIAGILGQLRSQVPHGSASIAGRVVLSI